MTRNRNAGYAVVAGLVVGLAYVANLQVLTWAGLGLTGWVYAGELTVMVVATAVTLVLWSRGAPESTGTFAFLRVLVAMVVVSELVRQSYMVLYVTAIDPGWVDRVVNIREQLLRDAGVAADQVSARLAAAEASFRPTRMLTAGVLLPSLWKLLFAGSFGLLARRVVRRVPR